MKSNTGIAATFLAVGLIGAVLGKTVPSIPIVSREEWGARNATQVDPMRTPVPYVVVHHSYIPGPCHTPEECAASMRSMQLFHQIDNGWNDIGYSFAVGGDGRAYMGRGWSAVGAHAPNYNDRSIGICVIGDWRTELPPTQQLEALKGIIDRGVREGYIARNYRMIGHRQATDTECPGDALMNEIKHWPNFVNYPSLWQKKKSYDE